ncbi:MAG: DUF1549 domain-containing protein [Saprospiraceae bacterium]|nr:DUF1549 domain-containing protein [Saprospiraceae bacterium]
MMNLPKVGFAIRGLGFASLLLLIGCGHDDISYNANIRPILNKNCLACHGGIKQSGGFSLLFEEDAYLPTSSGKAAIIRGDAKNSELVKRLHHEDPELRMPFDGHPLSAQEINLIEKWIDQGAKWEDHWAYRPPNSETKSPDIEDSWIQSPIDAFVLQRLVEEGLTPNQSADKASLLRRLTLDLIGLPPTLSEVKSYEDDPSDDAYEDQVDRLLASPHFGEHWGTMWLDLARYADSKGYEKDLYRSIWKYRDWVIDALNDDMPFDQFTIEQLAGDLLENPTEAQLIATAFHRNTMANDEGGTDNEEFRNYANIDRVSTTFEVWQGTTMACVQCHSHPYDPIRHEEFYQVMAFFNNTADCDIYHEAPNVFTYEPAQRQAAEGLIEWIQERVPLDIADEATLHEKRRAVLHQLDFLRKEAELFDASSPLIELTAPAQKTLFQIQDTSWVRYDQTDLTGVDHINLRYASPFGGYVEARLGSQNGSVIGTVYLPTLTDPADRNRWDRWSTISMDVSSPDGRHDLFFRFLKDKVQDSDLFRLDWFELVKDSPRWERQSSDVVQKLEQLYEVEAVPTPIMQELPSDERKPTHIFERGNWLVPGDEVTPGVPLAFGKLHAEVPTRLDLAQWLVSRENPLTARVIVNRFWEQIFGFGLVETVEDFGTQGIKPSHPQLLDWLAVTFRDSMEWSVKHLLKSMVMSSTYRQSAEVTADKLDKDPRNLLRSRGSRIRLTAEQLRDQVLAVSDLLNPKMHGPSARPPYPQGAGQFRFGDRYTPSEGDGQRRRSIYTYIKRTNPFPNRINFDGTDRTVCTSRRIRTNTPLQALALLNDPAYYAAAGQLAKFMMHEEEVDQMISTGYQKVMLRPIDQQKLAGLRTFYYDALSSEDGNKQAALTLVANAILNLDEFVNT